MPNFERMSLKDQLLYIETHMPDAWEYLHDIADTKIKLPTYDENDEIVREDKHNECGH